MKILTVIVAAIFPVGKYTWVKSKHTEVFEKNRKSYPLRQGEKIGVRPATSDISMFRVVTEKYGVNIVFSLDHAAIYKLAGGTPPPKKAPKVIPKVKPNVKQLVKPAKDITPSSAPRSLPPALKNAVVDSDIPKAWFNGPDVDTCKTSFWKADKLNVPFMNSKGRLVPLAQDKQSKFIYRAMTYEAGLSFMKGVTSSKGIYFTSCLADALVWLPGFASDNKTGSVLIRYMGKLDPKFMTEPDQLDHPNHVAYKGPLQGSKMKIVAYMTQKWAEKHQNSL